MATPALDEIENEVVQFVRLQFPQIAGEVTDANTELLSKGLDSLAVLELMTFLSERFGLELEEEDYAGENFETVGTISGLVSRKLA